MLYYIRPNKIFSALEMEGWDRVVSVRFSKRRGMPMYTAQGSDDPADCSLTYLETMVLLCAAKMVRCEFALEFGTHLGATTTNLAMNIPADGLVYTFDLAPVENFKEWHGANGLHNSIKAYQADTQTLDFHFIREMFELIWIDGCPDRRIDTKNAFGLLNPKKLSCIGWHDYGIGPNMYEDPNWPNTTEVIEELAETEDLYHIGETKTVLYFNRPMPQLTS